MSRVITRQGVNDKLRVAKQATHFLWARGFDERSRWNEITGIINAPFRDYHLMIARVVKWERANNRAQQHTTCPAARLWQMRIEGNETTSFYSSDSSIPTVCTRGSSRDWGATETGTISRSRVTGAGWEKESITRRPTRRGWMKNSTRLKPRSRPQSEILLPKCLRAYRGKHLRSCRWIMDPLFRGHCLRTKPSKKACILDVPFKFILRSNAALSKGLELNGDYQMPGNCLAEVIYWARSACTFILLSSVSKESVF